MKHPIIVIGAGHNSLVSAAYSPGPGTRSASSNAAR